MLDSFARLSLMARIVLVHGAFNELWGPNELKARWLPAVRDGLWHHGVEITDDDVAVCFYGDLFRRAPGTEREERLEQSRAGIAEALSDLAGGDAIAALGQAASDAAFDRTVDMVTIMATDARPTRADARRASSRSSATSTRVVVAHSLGTILSYMALCNHPQWHVHTLRDARFAARVADDVRHARSRAGRRQGRVAGIRRAVGQRASGRRQGRRGRARREVRPTRRGRAGRQRPPRRTRPSRTSTRRRPVRRSPPRSRVDLLSCEVGQHLQDLLVGRDLPLLGADGLPSHNAVAVDDEQRGTLPEAQARGSRRRTRRRPDGRRRTRSDTAPRAASRSDRPRRCSRARSRRSSAGRRELVVVGAQLRQVPAAERSGEAAEEDDDDRPAAAQLGQRDGRALAHRAARTPVPGSRRSPSRCASPCREPNDTTVRELRVA